MDGATDVRIGVRMSILQSIPFIQFHRESGNRLLSSFDAGLNDVLHKIDQFRALEFKCHPKSVSRTRFRSVTSTVHRAVFAAAAPGVRVWKNETQEIRSTSSKSFPLEQSCD